MGRPSRRPRARRAFEAATSKSPVPLEAQSAAWWAGVIVGDEAVGRRAACYLVSRDDLGESVSELAADLEAVVPGIGPARAMRLAGGLLFARAVAKARRHMHKSS